MDKWQSFFTNLKSIFNSKFGTEMSDDTSPTEALDIISAMEGNEASTENADAIQALTERMDRYEQAMQLVGDQIESINTSLAELSEGQVTESQLEEITTNIAGLEEQVNKVKMTYTSPSKTVQEAVKSGNEKKAENPKAPGQVSLQLSEILTGVIKN